MRRREGGVRFKDADRGTGPPRPRVIVLALRKPDGQMLFNPPLDTIIAAGDYLIVLGEQKNLERLERMVTG
jgi:voltage-gated potassium channel